MLRKTKIRISEMSAMAIMVPVSMLWMFRWERCAKTMLTPDASEARPGALAPIQACARSSSSRCFWDVRLRITTVMRVADFSDVDPVVQIHAARQRKFVKQQELGGEFRVFG